VSLPAPIKFRISEGDHFAFNKLMLGRSLKFLKLGLLLVFPYVALSVVLNGLLERPIFGDLMPLAAGVFAGGVFAIAMFAPLKSRARKVYRESASLQEEMTLIFQDDGFTIEQPSGLWRVHWRQLVRWDENRDIFIVFPNRLLAIIFPKHNVSDDVVDFMREQMKKSGLPRPWKLRK